jgi:hypothetical protein
VLINLAFDVSSKSIITLHNTLINSCLGAIRFTLRQLRELNQLNYVILVH